MNLQRRIKKLNERFQDRLGINPIYAWKHTSEIIYPKIELNDDGEDKHEYVCACGVDVIIHKPECRSLTLAQKKVVIGRILTGDEFRDRWVVCVLERWDPAEWRQTFGTHVTYPEDGIWTPVTFQQGQGGGHIKTQRGWEPSEADTDRVIGWVVENRMMTKDDFRNMVMDLQKQSEDRARQNNRDFIKEEIHASKVLNFIPGGKGHSSFQTPKKQQRPAQGAIA